MGVSISIYLERQEHGSWIFEGDRTRNICYDSEDPQDQPEFEPDPLFLGLHEPLHYLMGYPVASILEGPSPPFGRRGLPRDISAELGWWAVAEERNHFHGWITVRELYMFDWNALTAVRMVVERKKLKFYQNSVENSVVAGMAVDWPNVRSLGPIAWPDFPSLAPEIFADITWWPSYAELAGDSFMQEVVQASVRRYGPSDTSRIIYWFS